MYEELVETLRETADKRMHDAADAIETMREMVAIAHNELANVIQSYEESKPRWIPVTEALPEESEGLNWHEEMMIRFTSVWCCDAKTGTLEVRNRLRGKMTGNKYLDQYTKDTAWHWSAASWEPTHWMSIVPPPTPPKEET